MLQKRSKKVKPKPIVIRSHTFRRTSYNPRVFTLIVFIALPHSLCHILVFKRESLRTGYSIGMFLQLICCHLLQMLTNARQMLTTVTYWRLAQILSALSLVPVVWDIMAMAKHATVRDSIYNSIYNVFVLLNNYDSMAIMYLASLSDPPFAQF